MGPAFGVGDTMTTAVPMTPDEARAAVAAHIAALPTAVYRPLASISSVPTWERLGPVRTDLAAACARLLAAVDSGLVPTGPMPTPRYHGRPGPRPIVVTPPVTLPAIPELVEGAEAAAHRVTVDRMARLLREVGTVLETAPPVVAARAKAALARLAK